MEKKFTKEQIEEMKDYMGISVSYHQEAVPLFYRKKSEEDIEDFNFTESSCIGTVNMEVTVPIEGDNDSEDKCIANVSVDVLENPYLVCYDWVDAAEDMDGDIYEACEALNLGCKRFTTGQNELHNKMQKLLEEEYVNVFYIRSVFVEKDFRGCGIGKELVSNIERKLINTCAVDHGVMVLVANPFEIDENAEDYREHLQRLHKFYEDCGFTSIDYSIFLKLF